MSDQSLTASQRLGYGVGDFGINLFFISGLTYLSYFYTDVYGLPAKTAAHLLLVARLVDAVTDPLMGLIMDRTRTRWGNMRPYILFGAPPMGLLLVLTFTVPSVGDTGKLVYAYVTYILFGIAYTVITLPYSSLTAQLTSDYDERTRLSTVRMACAFLGGFAVSVATPELVGLANDEASGYRNTMLVYAVLGTAALWVTFAKTSLVVERLPSVVSGVESNGVKPVDQTNFSWRELDLRPVLANAPLWIVIGIFCCGMLGFTVRSAVTPYYFKYFVQRPDLISTYFGVTLLVMLVGLLLVPRIADRLGKIKTLYVGGAITTCGFVGLYFAGPQDIGWIFASGCIVAFGATPIAVLGWALLPDTVDYAEWRHGVRADGLIYSVASFVQKLAKAAGGAGVLYMLGYFGYVANAEPSADSLAAIVGLMSWVPALLVVPLVVIAAAHKLDEASHRRIVAELAAKPQAS